MNNYDYSKDSIMLEVEQNLDKTLKFLNSTRYNINENHKTDINTMIDINNFKHSKLYSILNEYALNYETVEYIHEIAKIETMEDLELAMAKISKTSSAPEKFSKIFKILSYLSSIAIIGGGGYSIADYIKSNASNIPLLNSVPAIASLAGVGGILALVGISLYGIDKIFSLFDYISKFIYWLCMTICKLITRNDDIDLERKKIMLYSMLSDIELMMKNRMNLNELEYLIKSKKYLESELLYLKS